MIPAAVAAGEVTLRPWKPGEAGTYARLRDDLVLRFTTEPPQLGVGECRRSILSSRRDPNQAPFAICDPSGEPVGNLTVVRRADTAELSYWLSAEARGRGWASTALRAATRWAFHRWSVQRAELEIDLDNQASMRVAEAAGYHRHGTRLVSACGGPAAVYRQTVHG